MKNLFKAGGGYKISRREFGLIAVLFIVLEIYVLYNYLLLPRWNEYQAVEERVSMTRQNHDLLAQEYAKLGELQGAMDQRQEEYEALQALVPPYVSQEDIILTLGDYADSSDLRVNSLSFDSPQSGGLEVLSAEEGGGAQSTGLAGQGAVVARSVSVSFTGEYAQLYKFLGSVEKNERLMTVRDIALQRQKGTTVSGSFRLTMAGYVDDSGKVFELDVPDSPQKPSLFTAYPGFPEDAGSVSGELSDYLKPNFSMTLSSYLDNAPKVSMAEYPKVETEINFNTNDQIAGKLTLTGTGGSYRYSYTLGTESYTGASAISVTDGVIRMNVISQARKSAQDKVGIILDVENKTDVPLEIAVQNDDPTRPRFELGKTSGEVRVN